MVDNPIRVEACVKKLLFLMGSDTRRPCTIAFLTRSLKGAGYSDKCIQAAYNSAVDNNYVIDVSGIGDYCREVGLKLRRKGLFKAKQLRLK